MKKNKLMPWSYLLGQSKVSCLWYPSSHFLGPRPEQAREGRPACRFAGKGRAGVVLRGPICIPVPAEAVGAMQPRRPGRPLGPGRIIEMRGLAAMQWRPHCVVKARRRPGPAPAGFGVSPPCSLGAGQVPQLRLSRASSPAHWRKMERRGTNNGESATRHAASSKR